MKSITTVVFSLLGLVLLPAFAAAQGEVDAIAARPAFRVTLAAQSKVVTAGGNAVLTLLIEASAATAVPAALLNGLELDVTVDGESGARIRDAGAEGEVALAADTRVERKLTVPVSRLLPTGGSDQGMTTIELQWPGQNGANCVLQIAPDLSKVDVDQLDLADTKVVLVTNLGEMRLAFYPDRAPETVKNFVKLAKDGFYDGTKFHRVIRNFMIQGGDPNTKDDSLMEQWGMGDPGYKIQGEVNETKHVRGVISMANSGSPDTAGSQFFICHKDAPHLNQGYTAFGALESGLDTLDRIANVPVGGPQRSRPETPVVLHRVVVLPALK